MKFDPERYAEYKRKDAENHRRYRANMNEAQRKKYNEKVRIRMKEYRQRKKENGEQTIQPMTRKQVEKRRAYWREKKRQQRSQMSDEKRRELAEKRKKRYLAAKKKLTFSPSKDSVRKASQRMNIPKNATMFAEAVNKVIQCATPKKKNALKEKGLVFTPNSKKIHETNAKIVANVKMELKKLKENQCKRSKQQYYTLIQSIVGKHWVERKIRKALDIKLQYMKRMSLLADEPIPKYDALSSESRECIKSFFKTQSVIIPHKRSVLKDGNKRSIMTESLKQAHKRFPGVKVSLSTFKRNRPKEVLTMDKEKFRTCLCEYCLNVEFKVDVLNRVCGNNNLKQLKLEDKYDCVQKTLCDTVQKSCYERTCNDCGVTKIREHFKPMIQQIGESNIKWKRWEIGTLNTASKEVRRQILKEKHGKLADLVTEFVVELQSLSKHIFVANWQREQFQKIRKKVPTDWVVSVADFAENYRCLNQDEIQSAYFNYQQATVFPLIAYYNCPQCDGGIVQDSGVFISPDMIHDADAVKEFTKQMDSHIREEVDFTHEVQFSDGCSAQFKSKKPFQNLSEVKTHTFERSFFGSRHGKSACDALGGLVKNQAERFVRSRQGSIQNAKDLYDFCKASDLNIQQQQGQCIHKRRTFFYIEHINRSYDQNDLKTVKGTQSIQSVRGIREGVVQVRNLSCFCPPCIGADESGECENSQYVDKWVVHSLKGTQVDKKRGNRKRKEKTVTIEKEKKNATVGKEDKEVTVGNDATTVKQKKSEMDKGEKRAKMGKGVMRALVDKESKRIKVENEEMRATVGKGEKRNTVDDNEKTEKTAMASNRVTHKRTGDDRILHCSNFSDLKKVVHEIEIEDLPELTAKSIVDTASVVDSCSLPLVPEDIPLKPESQLYPCSIYGDGNCLPRAVSVFVYNTQENHKEIRKLIVIELTKNEHYYLNNTYMSKGKHQGAQENVPKAFAQYSSFYMGQRLTKNAIKTLYEKEVLEIRKSGQYMGLWQIASLANILHRPVVSVCPVYGTHTVRNDMHRVFYPLNEEFHENLPFFVMWTTLDGVKQEEKEFALNHFDIMLPMTSTDLDESLLADYSVDDSFDLSNSPNSSILNIISNLMSDDDLNDHHETAVLNRELR